MPIHFKQVAIVGVGLIGGSLGMILKRDGLAEGVVGIGRSLTNLELAVKLGAIDRFEREAEEVMGDSDLVILATPVESYLGHLSNWAKHLKPGTIVSDVGSVKGQLIEQVEELVPPGVCFVGAHPIAGMEKSGVRSGSPDLFRGTTCILTPTARTNTDALNKVQGLWEAVGSVIISLDPFLHDWILGAVSHLPHIAAFALMNALADLQRETNGDVPLLDFSGGGLRDTTRIAASSPEMWRDILLRNRENLLAMIETYERHLQKYKELLKSQDGPGLEKEMAQAREARHRLK